MADGSSYCAERMIIVFFFHSAATTQDTTGALELALAAVGLILIFAKWETYRRGEVSSN